MIEALSMCLIFATILWSWSLYISSHFIEEETRGEKEVLPKLFSWEVAVRIQTQAPQSQSLPSLRISEHIRLPRKYPPHRAGAPHPGNERAPTPDHTVIFIFVGSKLKHDINLNFSLQLRPKKVTTLLLSKTVSVIDFGVTQYLNKELCFFSKSKLCVAVALPSWMLCFYLRAYHFPREPVWEEAVRLSALEHCSPPDLVMASHLLKLGCSSRQMTVWSFK